MGGEMPPGMGMGVPPPMPADPTAQMGLAALDRLTTKPAEGRLRLQRIIQALQMASKLIAAALPDVAETKPQVSKDLHIVGRQLADAIINIQQETELNEPPENLFAGMGAGLPGMGLPGAPGM